MVIMMMMMMMMMMFFLFSPSDTRHPQPIVALRKKDGEPSKKGRQPIVAHRIHIRPKDFGAAIL